MSPVAGTRSFFSPGFVRTLIWGPGHPPATWDLPLRGHSTECFH